MRSETATYRLQMCSSFTLDDAVNDLEYLSDLGISHVYSSPILQAGKGSTHGYDVLDHTRVNRELGGALAFERLSEALTTHNLGMLLDIVPNHMAIGGRDNAWWWDVLENGQASQYSPYFDMDWRPPESKLHHVILLPVLADHYGRILAAGDIHVERQEGDFTVHYHEHIFPIAPRSLSFILKRVLPDHFSEDLAFFADALGELPSSSATEWQTLRRRHRDKGILLRLLTQFILANPWAGTAIDHAVKELNGDSHALHDLLERQNYRLAFWRTAKQELGYRRFFDINSLIGLRTEDQQVFDAIHALVFSYLAPHGPVDGVRVDHPDGLLDPEEYLTRLHDHIPSGWILVEKILMPGEQLRTSWPVSGTSGYDFMNQVLSLFIDSAGQESLTDFYGSFTGETRSFPEILHEKKHQILRQVLGSDLNILTSMLLEICECHPSHRDYTRHNLHEALRELIASFSVYRSYARPRAGQVTQEDEQVVLRAIKSTEIRQPEIGSDLLGFIRDILLLKITGDKESDFVSRFQQVTGPVMAKGAEDTAFYCYHRFIALNEVGGDPDRFGLAVEPFHSWCQHIQQHWPKTMLGTSTHDTKRSEDIRTRLAILTQLPVRWIETVSRWSQRSARYWGTQTADHNFEYFWYQTLVGAWPLPEDRGLPYCEKAIREAKIFTSWTDPNTVYEEAVRSFVKSLYRDEAFLKEVEQLVDDLEDCGYLTSLSQTLIKMTAPGIPDIYQGTELWDFSLVDPDNRRPVDYEKRRRMLQELSTLSPEAIWHRRQDGFPKLWLIQQSLSVRHERRLSFGPQGTYAPLYARGNKSANVVSFMRGDEVISIAPRLVWSLKEGWGDTVIDLPHGRWRQVLDGQLFEGGTHQLRDMLQTFPVALLCKVA